jgi:hypothetical protein
LLHIYSIQYNKPAFIELQKKSFDKFIKEYTFTVIDNSIDKDISSQIQEMCKSHSINFIQTENKFDSRHNGLHGLSHEIGVNTFLNELKNTHNTDDIVMVLDHDIFLISDFSKITDIINDSSILTIKQSREHIFYVWPGLTIFNLKTCVNINEISLNGAQLVNGVWEPIDNGIFTDIGGHSYHYLKKYENELKFIDLSEYFINEIIENIGDKHIFFHFHAGSQWSGYSNEIWNNKFEQLKKVIE